MNQGSSAGCQLLEVRPALILGLLREHYGAFPRSPKPIPVMYTEEPEQTGPRRVTVKKPGKLGTVQISHKIPSATHADTPAMAVLDAILGRGKGSRLYRATIDTGLATAATASFVPTCDPGLHNLIVSLAPGTRQDAAEQAVLAEIARIQKEGVTAEEVAVAQKQLANARKFRRDGPAAIASELNSHIAVGDWTLFATYPENLAAVTPADVQRVARKYLVEGQSTTGWFVPITQ